MARWAAKERIMDQMDQMQFGAVCARKSGLVQARFDTGRGLGETLALWHRRWTTRRQLEKLSLRELEDIGIDPITAEREAAKPFWMM